MEKVAEKQILKGGQFLIKETEAHSVFTKSELTEEQKMFAQMANDFVETRVVPQYVEIDNKGYDLVLSLLDEAGELGLLGASLPENYGGMAVDFNTDAVINENLGAANSVNVAIAAHTGIGTLPILYFGTPEQKERYLPKLATGELKACYCLTEPGSGSDALSAKTKAVLSQDGTYYTVTGQKMWITNAGFADVFVVFAQIEEDDRLNGKSGFTGFIIEKGSDKLTLGAEEHKMGIKGSSTRQVFFEGVQVPVENVLGEIGKGHRIAFNVLNIGRFKLCVLAMGGSKKVVEVASKYANERIQFKVPISSFGAIQHKLAEMAVKCYACDAATYRTSGLINDLIMGLVDSGMDRTEAKLKAAEEYSIECAILKVFGSEVLDYVVDEGVQIYGGMGFSEESSVARSYRDARINRIFEGTNEINRLLTVDMLMKKAMKGKLDLMSPAMAIQKELMSVPDFGGNVDSSLFAKEKKALRNAKKSILMVAGAAVQKFQTALKDEQEIIMNIADMLIELFVSESTLLRTEKAVQMNGEEACSMEMDAMRTYLSDSFERINLSGKHAISGFAKGDEMRMMLMGLKRFTKFEPVNTIAARRRIAAKVIEQESYFFDN